jgi:hypothetical protein
MTTTSALKEKIIRVALRAVDAGMVKATMVMNIAMIIGVMGFMRRPHQPICSTGLLMFVASACVVMCFPSAFAPSMDYPPYFCDDVVRKRHFAPPLMGLQLIISLLCNSMDTLPNRRYFITRNTMQGLCLNNDERKKLSGRSKDLRYTYNKEHNL